MHTTRDPETPALAHTSRKVLHLGQLPTAYLSARPASRLLSITCIRVRGRGILEPQDLSAALQNVTMDWQLRYAPDVVPRTLLWKSVHACGVLDPQPTPGFDHPISRNLALSYPRVLTLSHVQQRLFRRLEIHRDALSVVRLTNYNPTNDPPAKQIKKR